MPSARSHIRTINQFRSPHENGLCKKIRGLCEFWDGNGEEHFFFPLRREARIRSASQQLQSSINFLLKSQIAFFHSVGGFRNPN
jgi:hypothetical protein